MKKYLIIISFVVSYANSLLSFDWAFYTNFHPDLRAEDITRWSKAMTHYSKVGIKEGRISTPFVIPKNNFDWQYYRTINKLDHITSESNTIEHYQTIGRHKGYPYCKTYKIAILVHLYNLELMDYLIDKINTFMLINNINQYYILINIPIGQNIPKVIVPSYQNITNEETHTFILNHTPYHKHLINDANEAKLYDIYTQIQSKIKVPSDQFDIIFSQNRGQDIGGFFLQLDHLLKNNIEHDFIVKLHTKSDPIWRNILTSFMDIPINGILSKHKALYSNKMGLYTSHPQNIINLKRLLFRLKLPFKDFDFCGGNMFIVSKEFSTFFKNHNLFSLFNMCNTYMYQKPSADKKIEHAFERLFGYLIDDLDLNPFIVDYVQAKQIKNALLTANRKD